MSTASRRVEFLYDLSSPYSYLAATQMAGLAQRTGAEVVWRPILLGAVFKAAENMGTRNSPARMTWVLTDLTRWARRYGIPLKWPSRFPMNTVKAQRLCVQAGSHQVALALRLFTDYFARDLDINDNAVLGAALQGVGFSAAEAAQLLKGCDDPAVKDALRANTDEALRRGVFGAPSFFVADDLYFGNDRLPFVEEALRPAQPERA